MYRNQDHLYLTLYKARDIVSTAAYPDFLSQELPRHCEFCISPQTYQQTQPSAAKISDQAWNQIPAATTKYKKIKKSNGTWYPCNQKVT